MAALLGATEEQARTACDAAPDACWLANLNAPGQVVIARHRRRRRTGDRSGARTPASAGCGPSRSAARSTPRSWRPPPSSSDPALDATTFAATDRRSSPTTTAGRHSDGSGWPDMLRTHLTEPVRWADCVDALVDLGATTFVEVGPGTTLTGLIRRIAPDAEVRSVQTPADLPLEVVS